MQSIASVQARSIAASFPAARAVARRGVSSSAIRMPAPMKNARQVVGVSSGVKNRRGVVVRADSGEQGSTKTTETPTIAELAPPEVNANTTAVIASADAPAAPTIDSGDTAWMLTSTALVLAMNIPGLSMFYGGLVGKKNVLSIFASCMALTCFMSLMWFSFGYSLSFGAGNAFIGDFSKVFLGGVNAMSAAVGTIPEPLWVMFQSTFAVIAPGLIIGAFAERMKFSAMLLFSAAWSVLVYYPFAHMVWGGGFLEHLGILDFAGGIVVHLTAGAAALLACIMIGPRKSGPVEPHNLPMMITGTGILWVGWFGFNAGSAVAANGGAAMAMVATMAAAAAGGATWMLLDWC